MHSPKSLREKVYNGDRRRPPLDESVPLSLKVCLQQSWEHNIQQRSSMDAIVDVLRNECILIRDGDDSGLEHTRRRSTYVFNSSQ